MVSNPAGMQYLQRDCHNICAWFAARGQPHDPEELFGELVGAAFTRF